MFNKNQTYEQHDNEKISFYRSSVEDLNSQDHLTSDIDADICIIGCLLYTSPSPRDATLSRMPSSA